MWKGKVQEKGVRKGKGKGTMTTPNQTDKNQKPTHPPTKPSY